ncbi:MAG: NADH-quinone oxidoreductase subunit E [Planctomycetota bacterium]|nr:MAG: NADH-quinone oxidoreductase subunit E [Planctomycetota bacterium]
MSDSHKRVDLIFSELPTEKTLQKIIKMTPDRIIRDITDSGLRGRGGAGFPTGRKWTYAREAEGDEKYIICNADEGEPGTFKDREILDRRSGKVFLGMAIAAKAVGANRGFIYLRGEYSYMAKDLLGEIDEFNKLLTSKSVDFKIELRLGAGAYVCGEETALIESMEGHRGEARNKPPFPATVGFRGKPTVVNNVETLVYATMIISIGPKKFEELGTKYSHGAKVFCISGDAGLKGMFELELGMKTDEFVNIFGDGATKAVQVGGASGQCVPRKKFKDTILGFEGVPTGGSMMLFNSSRSMYNVLKNYLEFFTEESCGQCTPCRVGCQQLLRGIEAVKTGRLPNTYLDDLIRVAKTMRITAKCGLGQSVANPFISIVDNFREEMMHF